MLFLSVFNYFHGSHREEFPMCGASTTTWICLTLSLSKSFDSLSFHYVYPRFYSFLLRSAFSSCGYMVKSLEYRTNISTGLKISACVLYAVGFLALEGLIGNAILINWMCRLFCYLEMPVPLLATEKEMRPTQMGLIIILEINRVATQVASNQII